MRWKIIGGLQTVFGTRKMLVTKSLCYDEENGKQEGMEFFVQLHGPTSNLELDLFFFFFQAEDGIRDLTVTGDQTCALPIFRPDVLVLKPRTAAAPRDDEDAAEWGFGSLLRPWGRLKSFPARPSAATGGRAFMETIKGEGDPRDWRRARTPSSPSWSREIGRA